MWRCFIPPLSPDIRRVRRHVSNVPRADIAIGLFDYLVGEGEQRGGDADAERLRGLEVDD